MKQSKSKRYMAFDGGYFEHDDVGRGSIEEAVDAEVPYEDGLYLVYELVPVGRYKVERKCTVRKVE